MLYGKKIWLFLKILSIYKHMLANFSFNQVCLKGNIWTEDLKKITVVTSRKTIIRGEIRNTHLSKGQARFKRNSARNDF